MIQQQRTGRPLATEFSTILRERGLLKFYRGLVRPICWVTSACKLPPHLMRMWLCKPHSKSSEWLSNRATLMQGLTACRDGLYTAGYLGVSPVLQQLLAESSALQGASPTTVFVTAGMASGFLAALVTQPVDTIKTRVQVLRCHGPTLHIIWKLHSGSGGAGALCCLSWSC